MVQDIEAGPTTSVTAFGDRLAEAVERKRSQLLVGLDPMPELLPLELAGEAALGRREAADACARFCRGVIDAVAAYAVGVKPQLAFFEALGPPGMEALESVCAYARTAGLIVVADAKRGDIGSTARAYASAYLEGGEGRQPLADAMTVNPYLGLDSLEPFIAACRREGAGIFCLVKTSNEGVEAGDLGAHAGRARGSAARDDDAHDVVLVAEADRVRRSLLRPALRVFHRVARAGVPEDEEDLVVGDVPGRGRVRLGLERSGAGSLGRCRRWLRRRRRSGRQGLRRGR